MIKNMPNNSLAFLISNVMIGSEAGSGCTGIFVGCKGPSHDTQPLCFTV